MKVRTVQLAGLVLVFLLTGLFWQTQVHQDSSRGEDESTLATLGTVDTLLAAYNRWKAAATQHGAERNLTLSLMYSKGLSATFTKAHGQASLDLVDGTVTVEVLGLPEAEAFDVWLIDNRPRPGHSAKPEPGDAMIHVGSLQHEAGVATLRANLDSASLSDFQLDLVVVAPAGSAPGDAGLLFGSPSLFQRFYYSEQQGQFARLGDTEEAHNPDGASRSLLTAPFRALIPSPAHAQMALPEPDVSSSMERLIARGQRLFFEEQFDGNGRTCGTCHPAVNNFTIDPAFIATLPSSNPLFVAERNRDLAQLENPRLMRRFGLILENVDGLENPTEKFVMRSVPHTLALSMSTCASTDCGTRNQTGWSGDGAPNDGTRSSNGTLRAFAIGAVRQHFTKTLNRVEDEDFRRPTEGELDALEAFQLSLGRKADPDLGVLTLLASKAIEGQGLFRDATHHPSGTTCNSCHANAGANAGFGTGGNRNFNTGVEDFPHPAGANGEQRPRDGGSGITANPQGGFGDGRFNTPPLVEAADTGPFFHNNAVRTIEDAVEFYTSAAFGDQNGGPFDLVEDEVEAIAAFLRVINALENIRSSIDLERKALRARNATALLRQALKESNDAIKVLSARSLPDAAEAVRKLQASRRILLQALGSFNRQKIEQAIQEQKDAREELCVRGSEAVLCPSN